MKKISFLLIIAVLLILIVQATSWAQGTTEHNFGMVGITMGQTARLNVVNVSDPEDRNAMPCRVELMFFDSDGDMLDMMMVSLDPGMAAFHDLGFPAGVAGRLQIRAVVLALGGPDTKCKNIKPTLEIYDNQTMKTEVFQPPPDPE